MKFQLSVAIALFCVAVSAQTPIPGERRRPQNTGQLPAMQPPATEPGTAPALPTPLDLMHAGAPSTHWITTTHTWNGSLHYTATCGFIPIKDENDQTEADMFFVAYTKDGAEKGSRPVTFAFNGGPGSSSVWLHMGALGPVRAQMNPDGSLPAPPYRFVENEQSWLPFTDVVMVDAVGTGYSRVVKADANKKFYGLTGDLAAFTTFIKGYLSETSRWRSPVFVAGESYGGIRVAGLSYTLLQQGIAVNGIISISGVMNFGTIDPGKDNDLPYISYLPAECAVAMYHHRLSHEMEANFHQTIQEAEQFASGEYAAALMKGDALTEEQRKHIAARVASFIGVSPLYVDRSDLRVSPWGFRAELLRDSWDIVGRYDGRLVGHNSSGVSQAAEYDPSDVAVTPVFTAAFNDYISSELNFHTTESYRTVAYGVLPPWDYGTQGGFPDTSEMLRRAMEQNPHMKVMLCCGWYDLACPYFGMRYAISHMGEQESLKKNIRFAYFPAGHMLYIDTPSREKFVKDIGAFYADATGPGR